jgi:hypothetical protein
VIYEVFGGPPLTLVSHAVTHKAALTFQIMSGHWADTRHRQPCDLGGLPSKDALTSISEVRKPCICFKFAIVMRDTGQWVLPFPTLKTYLSIVIA